MLISVLSPVSPSKLKHLSTFMEKYVRILWQKDFNRQKDDW